MYMISLEETNEYAHMYYILHITIHSITLYMYGVNFGYSHKIFQEIMERSSNHWIAALQLILENDETSQDFIYSVIMLDKNQTPKHFYYYKLWMPESQFII